METNDKKILCLYKGGSHLYGLNNANSDIDLRGVFVYNDPLVMFGFKQDKPYVSQNATEDIALKNINDFIRLLMKGNTEAMECLHADSGYFDELDPAFRDLCLYHRNKFVDSEKLFKCFMGYIQGELRLANGERTGLLGSKRKAALDRYGFSYKNFSHLIRLIFCGEHFFKTGIYPVRLRDHSQEIHDLCFEIKTCPENFTKEQLNNLVDFRLDIFTKAYDNRLETFTPDLEHIKKTVIELHKHVIEQL